ncbi:GNAT family N-acetyltransferase [Streptomyces sp. NPDC058045]|uniref:GNAT family N-acetyltransferase n=1 Tax=Streptomyces sp. NPDC058045 TaxID=3346311 RepID=UPI0036E2C1CC
MPSLIDDVIGPGGLGGREQPELPAGGGLLLRPWRTEDAPAVHRAFQDPLLERWHARSCRSIAEAAEWIGQWQAAWPGEQDAFWAVAEADSGALRGRVALRGIRPEDGIAEVAYWTVPEARGTGVAPRAVRALACWALDEVGFHRLELTHATGNASSCRVAGKCGFALEGVQRSAALHADGWHDTHLHARISTDPAPPAE